MRCSECTQYLGDIGTDYKQATLSRDPPLTAATPHNDFCRDDFVLREFCSPGCGTALAIDIQLGADEILPEATLVAGARGERPIRAQAAERNATR